MSAQVNALTFNAESVGANGKERSYTYDSIKNALSSQHSLVLSSQHSLVDRIAITLIVNLAQKIVC